MLMFDKNLKYRIESVFSKLGFEVNLIHVTRKSLENKALRSGTNILQYMKRLGLHDYIGQESGWKNRKLIDTKIISDGHISDP